jgi:hypothetical protein
VKVKCFGCDASVEADAADRVVEAFVVHGQESHTWRYPEEAIRNYARNYAEAGERLTGSTVRLADIGDVLRHFGKLGESARQIMTRQDIDIGCFGTFPEPPHCATPFAAGQHCYTMLYMAAPQRWMMAC